MAKKPKAPALHRWRITHIKGTPAKFLDYVEATDEASAIEAAVKEFKDRRSAPGPGIVSRRDEP